MNNISEIKNKIKEYGFLKFSDKEIKTILDKLSNKIQRDDAYIDIRLCCLNLSDADYKTKELNKTNKEYCEYIYNIDEGKFYTISQQSQFDGCISYFEDYGKIDGYVKNMPISNELIERSMYVLYENNTSTQWNSKEKVINPNKKYILLESVMNPANLKIYAYKLYVYVPMMEEIKNYKKEYINNIFNDIPADTVKRLPIIQELKKDAAECIKFNTFNFKIKLINYDFFTHNILLKEPITIGKNEAYWHFNSNTIIHSYGNITISRKYRILCSKGKPAIIVLKSSVYEEIGCQFSNSLKETIYVYDPNLD